MGLGDTYNLGSGPNIATFPSNRKIENSYYFNDLIFSSSYNQKTTLLALWDTTFQNQILDMDAAFNVDEFVNQGYYPQLDMPECMPAQEYINLPEVQDKDLPDILSTEVLEQGTTTIKVKFRVNNPSAETITNIEVKNLNCDILSQEYKDGVSEVIAELNNPIICVSGYSVLGITTKGAYNQEYTREFEENERKINVELFREIHSIEDWEAINKSLTENYKLMTDLDMRNQGANVCINAYKGILNGNNHTIKNITIPNNKTGVFGQYLSGTVKNLYIENVKIENNKCDNVGFIGGMSSKGKVDNVHIRNMSIIGNESTKSEIHVGGITAYSDSGSVENSSVNNLSIKINNSNASYSIGGIIGFGYNASIENCYIKDLNFNLDTITNSGIGGLAGSSGIIRINNSYASGVIESNDGNIGGIAGYGNMYIDNCYSKVDIISDSDYIAGLVGNSTRSVGDYSNNLVLGNIYSSKITQNIKRMVGNLDLTGNNYAYSNQLINGYISNEILGASQLLIYNDLTNKTTYINKLQWENIYNISNISKGVLPKLKYKDSDELLPNQEDIYIENELILDIDNVESNKDGLNNVLVRIDINNPQELEVTGIEIEGMNHTINTLTTRNGETYINLTATPIYCYDTYRISKIKYKIDGTEYEKDVAVRIEQQFYKEIYTFEDWQSIEIGTYQNYRLMADIDFSGRTNIKTNITMARLEGVNGRKTLKNINLEFNDENVGLIKEITTNLEDINFENISIKYNEEKQNVGIISKLRGSINNSSFKDITIDANVGEKVGVIGSATGSVKNVDLNNVSIIGNSQVGSLVGNSTGTIDYITAKEINITAKDYIGGIIGYLTANITNISIDNAEVTGNNYVGGIVGYVPSKATIMEKFVVSTSTIRGNSYIGGMEGAIYGYGSGERKIYNSHIIGTGDKIGGISGSSAGSTRSNIEIVNCSIEGIGENSNYIGGLDGTGNGQIKTSFIKNSKIEATGNYVGGFNGESGNTNGNQVFYNYAENIEVTGYSKVGGIFGKLNRNMQIRDNYINATVCAIADEAGGLLGFLDNIDMTAVSNTSSIYRNYFIGNISGQVNIGGMIGNIADNLYMPENYYYSNYIEAYLTCDDTNTVSLGIGGRQNQNSYLKDTYYYKFSSINGENPNAENEMFITEDYYLKEEELKQQDTYISKLKWSTGTWNMDVVVNNKYPILKDSSLTAQTGIDLPIDSEHIIGSAEDSAEMQSIEVQEAIEQTFEYNNKTIQTYSTYSLITAEDGSQATRNAKLYVKDNTLYVIPSVVSANEDSEVVPVANNLIIDSYNGKEYETVLGSDGKIYDLKEPIEYPENFVNSDIESIGNNLNSDTKEVEVTYKNGDKIKFNYQTGEIIYSSEVEDAEKTGLFEYLKEKISEIGNSNSGVSQEITNKYEASKELQTKLEETSVEEAIEKQNIANSKQETEGVTTTENNVTNNSFAENKYISMYNEETGQHEIYNEEELLDTSKEEVVSENEKIEANNLSEYYASEGETKNTKMGIVWIVISIIGVGIILFVLRKNLKKKNA